MLFRPMRRPLTPAPGGERGALESDFPRRQRNPLCNFTIMQMRRLLCEGECAGLNPL
jgi:hypothetical protein